MSKISLAGTHLPILSKILTTTTGPVLELGSGWNSTPLMYWTCKAEGRLFKSYENDKKWVESMEGLTEYTESWDLIDIDDTYWSVVLIDCRPAKKRRELALRLKRNADYILLHDSEPEINSFYGYKQIRDKFTYSYQFDKLKPNTLVLSNICDLKYL